MKITRGFSNNLNKKMKLVNSSLFQEHDLWEFLNMLEVVQFTPHPVFGLPSKLIGPTNAAEFISQGS